MSDPRQTGRSAGARAGGESGEDSTLIRSAKDFYGDDSPTEASRADRVMGRLRGRSGEAKNGGQGSDAQNSGSTGAGTPDRSAGARVDTGATPNRAAGEASTDSSNSSGGNAGGRGSSDQTQPIAAQESKGGRARLGAAAASAGGVVGGLTNRKKAARTGSAAEAVPAPGQGGQSSGAQASSSGAQTATQSRPASADSGSEPTRQIPAQGDGQGGQSGRSGRAAGAGAAAGGAAGAASGAAAGKGRRDNNEPSGLARPETPKKQLGAARRTLKARLRVSQVDPWSVMKTAFLFSFAAGIVLVVAVLLVYLVLSQSGLFVTINQTVGDIISTPGDDTPFDITDYISFPKVLGASIVIGAIDVVIYTALATLGAFLYNLAAATIGGLEVTLAED